MMIDDINILILKSSFHACGNGHSFIGFDIVNI